jgi:hypothetical protein
MSRSIAAEYMSGTPDTMRLAAMYMLHRLKCN